MKARAEQMEALNQSTGKGSGFSKPGSFASLDFLRITQAKAIGQHYS